MIDVSRLAKRASVLRLESPRARLLVAPGLSTTGTTPPIVATTRYLTGITARIDLVGVLKTRLPVVEVGAMPTPIGDRVRRARALREQARLMAEEASLAAMDAEVKDFAQKLGGT